MADSRPKNAEPIRFLPQRDWMGLNADAFCCCIMSIGVIMAFDQLFRFRAGGWTIVWHAAVITAALLLLTWRKWLLPAVLFGGAAVTAAALVLSGTFGDAAEYIAGLAEWWIELFPSSSLYDTPGNIALVQWIIHIFITAILYFLVRRVRLVSILAISAALLFAAIHASGFRENILPLVLIFIGMMPLLTRNSRVFTRNTTPLAPSWLLQHTAAALCAAAALVVSLLLPGDTSRWKAAPLTNLAADIQSLLQLQTNDRIDIQPLTLQSAGLQPDVNRLGGDIELNSISPVLSVETDTPMLLKGSVYDIYTGGGWESTGVTAYRLNNSMFSDEFRRAFDLNKPAGTEARALLDRLGQPAQATVTLLRSGSSLYSQGRMSALEELTGVSDPVLFNSHSELYVRRVLDPLYSYRFSTTLLPREGTMQSLLLRQLAQSVEGRQDAEMQEVRSHYLSVPSSLPSRVSQEAYLVTAGAATDYERMELLENYFQTNYRYTLTPGEVPPGADFVEYFLQTRQGYCVYFASAMAVMARTLGVPARFVVGYGLEYAGGGLWIARDRNAHAWVECYISGIGWVTFDPTAGSGYRDPPRVVPPDIATETSEDSDSSSQTGSTGSTTGSTETGTATETGTGTQTGGTETTTEPSTSAVTASTGEDEGPPQFKPGGNHFGIPGWLPGLIAGVLALAAAALLLWWRIRRARRLYRLEDVRARWPSAERQAAHYYAGLLRQLRLLGYVPQTGETMRRFAQRIAQDDGVDAAVVTAAFEIMMGWRYGEQPPRDEDVQRIEKAFHSLDAVLRTRLGSVKYFLRCVLIGL